MISVEELTVTYRSGKGIFDVSFSVGEGEVFGYLGPNGAGKTTTIRALMGFTNPDKGQCSIKGLDCRAQAREVQRFLGYLPGEIAFFDEMTGNQFLHFMSDMRRQNESSRTEKLIDMFELDTRGRIRKMSKGMKQKLGIIAAFMHDPDVYILDEPTSGLDPLMQKVFVELILGEKSRGKTILMSSHGFGEVELTCDRAGIIREGRLIAVEDIRSLKASQRKVHVVTVAGKKDIDILKSSNLELGKITDRRVEVFISSNYDEFIDTLSKCDVEDLDVPSQSLEEVFMKYYGQEGAEDESHIA